MRVYPKFEFLCIKRSGEETTKREKNQTDKQKNPKTTHTHTQKKKQLRDFLEEENI